MNIHPTTNQNKSFNARVVAALCFISLSSIAAGSDAPQQIHIAAATRSSFRVSWKTQNTTASQCLFGASEDNLSSTATGQDGYQYLVDHGYHHNVLLDSLPTDSTYYYSCGDGTPENMSPIIKFKTAPSSDKKIQMAIFGDWGFLDSVQRPMDLPVGGLQKNWTATLTRELLESMKDQDMMDSVWIVGDLGYVDDAFGHTGYTLHDGYEPCYDGWMQWQQNYSSIMPLMVSQGNHESECKIHLRQHTLLLYNYASLSDIDYSHTHTHTRTYQKRP
jgi:acid phosphatase type 7